MRAFVVCSLLAVAASLGCSAPSDESEAGNGSGELTVTAAEADRILYLGQPVPATCANQNGDARVRCLIGARYASDPAARDIALALYAETGGIAGVAPEQDIDGGFRGKLHLVPELPVGVHRKHLEWTQRATRDLDAFFGALRRSAREPIRYRWQAVNFRFFRSVGRTTPSAYVEEDRFEIFYNVTGSLMSSPAAVRETFFHELFHVNDVVRDEWSSRVLAPIVNAIAKKCGTNHTCLAPYAPTDTRVRGGTYYAFQPNANPLEVEYSAELASRYFEEQHAMMSGERLRKRPFKCGPPENARAWNLLAGEFFGGGDLVPACD